MQSYFLTYCSLKITLISNSVARSPTAPIQQNPSSLKTDRYKLHCSRKYLKNVNRKSSHKSTTLRNKAKQVRPLFGRSMLTVPYPLSPELELCGTTTWLYSYYGNSLHKAQSDLSTVRAVPRQSFETIKF